MNLTIISPCFNESANIEELVERTHNAVKSFSEKVVYEHILIDNASSDNSIEIMKKVRERFPQVRILQNSENAGVFSSIQRAMKLSRGEWLIPFLASDMQDPPEIVALLLGRQLETDCDAVFGVRKKRKESYSLFILRKFFYFLLRKFISGRKYVSGTSEFCLIKKNLSLNIIENEDPNPFLRIYLSKLTSNIEYVNFSMVERKGGKSSANLFTLLDDALNAFSIIMPSVFSRLMVFVIPFSLTTFLCVIVSLPFTFSGSLHFSYLLILLAIQVVFAILFIQLLIGHYIFILHSQIRKKPEIKTQEL
jgi:glycosyltransferase involved in cell wall biosynthesis